MKQSERRLSPSDKVLEDAALSGGLTSDDGDLRQIDSQRHSEATEGVLEAIHDRDELGHPNIPAWRPHREGFGGEGVVRRGRSSEEREE